MTHKPLVLIILDGWGHREEKKDNAIKLASPLYFDKLCELYPHTLIDGSGPAVGLPKGVMGNSEVGHSNLGAGRVVYSGLSQIYHAIEDGSFFTNQALNQAVAEVKKKKSTLHLLGLLSDGAVHSHQDHLYALLSLAKKNGVSKVLVHCFLDGRDTAPHEGITYLEKLLQKMREIGVGRIASISGRYFAMDRDKRWERTERAFWAICGQTENLVKDALAHIKLSYQKNMGDEFIEPVSVLDSGGKVNFVGVEDSFIFFNFRADRARQLTHAFVDKEFSHFDRRRQILPEVFVCMAPYEKNFVLPVAFSPTYPQRIFPEILAAHDIPQLRIAETEKYAHVTYFFNGGRDVGFPGEERVLIASPRDVATYDERPEMSALEIKDRLLKILDENRFGFILLNFANADMVGHTAKPQAIITAVKTVDACLREIVPRVLEKKGELIITADHGNAEQMVDDAGKPLTSHTTNLVPLVLVSERLRQARLKSGGRLCDVAPTLLQIMGLEKPKEMTGESLIVPP